eukprot:CAMPEP_0117655888 /NCGR_PEP_ID=MMETSP0804-20121206/4515_1 /TAXON_ID=1074897 /ORGANISM="Tetraselmis astigmatica, Strain CCMP880" /LENGTH=881 /DNA_ID=CAMNT_0005462261 /DNA_START=165 /DNA_END=2810 /DNA_ORIENTATION=-
MSSLNRPDMSHDNPFASHPPATLPNPTAASLAEPAISEPARLPEPETMQALDAAMQSPSTSATGPVSSARQIIGSSPELIHVVPDLTRASQVMESRKSIRRWRGINEPTRPGLTWVLFVILILTLTYMQDLSGLFLYDRIRDLFPDIIPESGGIWLVSFGVTFESSNSNGQVGSWDVALDLAVLFGLLTLFYMAIKAQVYYRLKFANWILAAYLLTTVVYRILATFEDYPPASIVGPLFIFIFATYLVYVLVVLFLWHQVPKLQLEKGWFLPKVWAHRIFPVPNVTKDLIAQVYAASGREQRIGNGTAAVKIHYSSFMGRCLPHFLRKLVTVTYSGEVDKDGLPHGLGEWNDTYYHGEELLGWWEHGAPSGPFHSQESGSGAGFKRLLIPYFRNRTDGISDITRKIEHGPITCGIIEVECCTAGIFFREYPKAGEFHAVKPSGSLPADIRETLNVMLPMPESGSLGSVVIQADLLRGLLVSGHSVIEGKSPSSVVVDLCDHNGRRLERSKTNIPNFALMLAKSYMHRPVQDEDAADGGVSEDFSITEVPTALPPDDDDDAMPMAHLMVQPRLSVPGWNESSYTNNNEAIVFLPGFNSTTISNAKILAQLLALGNFPSYLKPFIYSWPAGDLMGFAGAQTHGAEANQTSQDLKAFLIALGETGIKNIHFLTHSMGIRVLTAALPTLEEIFVPANPLAPSNCKDGPERALHLSTVLLLNTEIGRHEFVDCYARRLTDMCGCISIYADGSDVALIGSELCNSLLALVWPNRRSPKVMEDLSKAPMKKQLARQNSKWEYSLGRIKKDLLYADGQLVDVDIIQTTHLGANVQSVRHSAWSLNRELVDDLRDTIVNKQRAFQRSSRLQYRGGNRYNFLVAPTHVVNP